MLEISSDLEKLSSTDNPEEYCEMYESVKTYQIFQDALNQLSDKHKAIIMGRHNSKKVSFRQLSMDHNLSIENIKKLESEAIIMMQNYVSKIKFQQVI